MVAYQYNGDGLRTRKEVNGLVTVHIWDGNQIALELNGAGAVTHRYVGGINLIFAQSGATQTFYLFNGHGDVVQLTDPAGVVIKTYDYDAFGNELNPDPLDTNVFRYCGEYFDKETGTYYLRARYYNPVIGRFVTEDTVWSVRNKLPSGQELVDPLSLNLYVYVHNNPILYIDESGHFIGAASGFLIGGLIGGVSAAIQGKDILTGIASGAVSGAVVGAMADVIAFTGGTGLIAVTFMSGAGALGSGIGNMIDQLGNVWKWGAGEELSVAAKNLDFNRVGRSVAIGTFAGAATGATGQLLTGIDQTSIMLYKSAILSGASPQTVKSVCRAVLTSRTTAYMIDTMMGGLYTITASGIEYLVEMSGIRSFTVSPVLPSYPYVPDHSGSYLY